MLDVAVSYNKYKFLGNEFLTWLWYVVENDIDLGELTAIKDKHLSLEIGNSIVLENTRGDDTIEKISIKGDDAGLEEGTLALQKGAVVTDINLVLKIDENEYKFTIKGESLNITGLKTPPIEKSAGEDEIEGAILEKTYLCIQVFELIDILFSVFVRKRISEEWKSLDIPAIRKWISS